MGAWQFGLPPGFPQRADQENCRPGRAARVRNSAGKPTELRELRVSPPDARWASGAELYAMAGRGEFASWNATCRADRGPGRPRADYYLTFLTHPLPQSPVHSESL